MTARLDGEAASSRGMAINDFSHLLAERIAQEWFLQEGYARVDHEGHEGTRRKPLKSKLFGILRGCCL